MSVASDLSFIFSHLPELRPSHYVLEGTEPGQNALELLSTVEFPDGGYHGLLLRLGAGQPHDFFEIIAWNINSRLHGFHTSRIMESF